MKNPPGLSWLLASLFFLSVSACSHTTTTSVMAHDPNDPEAPKIEDKECIAIFPFDNLTQYPNAGRIVADLMSTAFFRSQKFRVMERGEIERIATLSKVALPQKITARFARTMGEALDVDVVLIGSVTEYAYLDPTTGNPGVSINANLVDVASGKSLWVGTDSRVSSDQVQYKKDPVNRVALLSVDHLTASLFDEVPKRRIDYGSICGNAEAIIAPLGPDLKQDPLYVRVGTLAGRTIQKNGTALGMVTLEIPDRGLSRVLTDPDTGSFRIENLTPGAVKIIATKEGYAAQTFEAKITPGKMTMLDLELPESAIKVKLQEGSITGKVLDPKGKAVKAAIFLNSKRMNVDLKSNTAEDGKFLLKVLPGEYQVRVIAKGFITQSKTVRVESKSKVILNISLHPEREF